MVVLAGAGVGLWAWTRPAAAATYRLVAASSQTLRQTVSSSGTIEPAQQENLDFAVSGQVTGVTATVGEQVTAGQALATVNSASLAATVAEAQASLSSDQSRLSSDQTADSSSAQVIADQAAVTAAQNQLTDAQNALTEATLTSPIAGTVASVDLTVGQQVSGGSGSSSSTGSSGSSGGGSSGGTGGGSAGGGGSTGSTGSSSSSSSSSSSTGQVVVISSGSYVINASVDDTEVGQVKTGDQAIITPDGSTSTVYGTVGSVAMLASGSATVPSYPVTINVTGSPTGLYPGASATVSIIVKQLSGVLAVPSTAIHFSGGKSAVTEMSGGKQVSHAVTTGLTENGYTQILTGLSAGDQVVVAGAPAGAGGAARTGGGTTRTGGGAGGFGGGAGGFGGGGGGFGGGAGGFGGGGGGGFRGGGTGG
ncbi:MAG TPA: efflux RND transporter periplasmic adaptor subunit [Pseudonocardiaceae bacterium]|nr:efflux RND transporter periplasmic adaptor subunit [Pseudonocardiaceae bacterium]